MMTEKTQDVGAVFRFLDLPPEMRTMIYRELLAEDPHEVSAQILRVSKTINEEAADILNDKGELKISIKSALANVAGPPICMPSEMRTRVRVGTFMFESTAGEPVLASLMKWPKYLHDAEVSHISIAIDFEQRSQAYRYGHFSRVDHEPYVLLSLLPSKKRARTIRVDFHDPSVRLNYHTINDITCPITKLGTSFVDLLGWLFRTLRKIFQSSARCSTMSGQLVTSSAQHKGQGSETDIDFRADGQDRGRKRGLAVDTVGRPHLEKAGYHYRDP